jgi:hypothetical protein
VLELDSAIRIDGLVHSETADGHQPSDLSIWCHAPGVPYLRSSSRASG